MGFFYNETRAEPRAPKKIRLQDIPVESLRRLSCEVCPRSKDSDLRTPKMVPDGPERPSVYLLGAAPSSEDDKRGQHFEDAFGREVLSKLGSDFVRRHVRMGHIQQCAGDQTPVELECCRGRVVSDIERSRPQVVVGIGDAPLRWAVGDVGTALLNRGQLFVARFGSHVCWYYCLLYPNYVSSKRRSRSEYELAMEHDARRLRDMLGKLPPARVYDAPYDRGIEQITGRESSDWGRLQDALHALAREPRSALDIETTGLRPYMLAEPRILTAAVGTFERTVAFSVDHPQGWGSDRRRREVKGAFRDYLLESGRKACHALGFEMEWLEHEYGPELLRRTEWDDTMAMAHTLHEQKGTHSLDYQTRKRFGFALKDQSRVDVRVPKWWEQFSLEDTLRYNGMDTKWTDLLRDDLAPEVREENQREYDRKVRLAPTLVVTETRGICVDGAYMRAQKEKLETMLVEHERRLRSEPEVKRYEQRFGRFSPTNPDHVLRLYKEVEPRDEIRVENDRDKTVRWTTEEDALAKIKLPSAEIILECREVEKLKGTYVEPVVAGRILCRDGKIRCKYGSMVAETGRLNSEDPNVQNWPKRTALGRATRGAIVPPAGHAMAPLDYGQIEFRVIGMASEDPNLVKYCWTGYDVHGYWAQRMVKKHGRIKDWIVEEFKVDWDEKGLKTLRQESKNGWVFPMFFGSLTRSCAQRMHLPEEVAEDLAEEFWDEFREVRKWQERLIEKYERTLYVETLGGRKRRGAMTKNVLINHPIQGTAADIVLEAMCALSEKAEREDDPYIQPVLNVHDDLTFYIPDELVPEKLPVIAREMCMPRFSYVNVPLIVEASLGLRWNEAAEVAKYSSEELFGLRNPYK